MARAPFRSVPVGSPEAELSGIKKPPGFAAAGDRSGGVPLGDAHPIAAGDTWEVAPSTVENYKCNLEQDLVLKSSNSAAKLRITYHIAVTNF